MQVSDGAKSLLKNFLEERSDPAHVLRLSQQGDSFGLRFDAPAEGDVVIQHEGTDVLAVASDVANTLDDVTIDQEDSPEGPRLVLVR